MREPNPTHNVLCVGEALWDCLPDGEFPGGAPLNVAYHLAKTGCTPWLVSSVGDDERGASLLSQLNAWGLARDFVRVDGARPTGVVRVRLDAGLPSYDIAEDVAWDHLVASEALSPIAQTADAIVYGSLAMRGPHNRKMLTHLIDRSPRALKVFDVNLRPPYDNPERIRQLAQHADLIKLNDEEIGVILGTEVSLADLSGSARKIASWADCDRVCVTAGADGAGLLDHNDWHWVRGERVVVSDTVGAGDAFLAALVAGLIQTPDVPSRALARASRLAAFVASKPGATPDYHFH